MSVPPEALTTAISTLIRSGSDVQMLVNALISDLEMWFRSPHDLHLLQRQVQEWDVPSGPEYWDAMLALLYRIECQAEDDVAGERTDLGVLLAVVEALMGVAHTRKSLFLGKG